MGGVGAWKLASEFPDRFAAMAPVCGHPYIEHVNDYLKLPIWAFHGEKDPVVKPEFTQQMVDALHKLNATEVKLKMYAGQGHSIWDETYSNPELYQWFLQHTKEAKR